MRSMTGFGEATCTVEGICFVVSVRSLNHKFLDIRVRVPGNDMALENELAALVRRRIQRGAITLEVRKEKYDSASQIVPAIEKARALLCALETLREHLGLDDKPTLGLLVTLLGGVESEGPARHGRDLAAHLAPAVEEALSRLEAEQRREGETIGREIRQRLVRLQDLTSSIARRSEATPQRFKERLLQRLAALEVAPVDEWRLAHEVAFLADRADVSEELERISCHLQALFSLLEQEGPVGKRFDFLLQEVHREISTLAVKAQDTGVSHDVVEMKVELEKIREQIQNIE